MPSQGRDGCHSATGGAGVWHPERGDTVLRHPHSSVPPQIGTSRICRCHSPGHPLCSLCFERVHSGGCNSGRVKTELGLWGARGSAIQVLFIGTAVGGVSVTWRITGMLGFTEQTLGLQGFSCPAHSCFGKAREPSEGKRHTTHWLHNSLHHLGVRITIGLCVVYCRH